MPLPLLPPDTFDFTGLDYEDMMTRARTLAHQVCPQWRDFSSNYPENVLLELAGLYYNMLRSTTEERARQGFWATVSEKLAAIRLGRATSYTLSGATAATLTGRFSLPSGVATRKIPLPAGTRVRVTTGEQPRYVTLADAEIAVGASYADVSCENTETVPETFVSSGEANQELLGSRAPYIEGSVVVTVGGVVWTRVASGTLTASAPDDQVYVTMLDSRDRLRVIFGNDVNGAIPPKTTTIEVSYKIGDGAAGEVSANASWLIEDTIYDELGQATTLVFTNPSASSVAENSTTVEEARVLGPLSGTTRDTATIEDDFENAAVGISGIARAACVTSNADPSITEDYGILYVVARGSRLTSGRYPAAAPTAAQLTAVSQRLTYAGGKAPVLGFSFTVQAAVFRTINVAVKIYKAANTSQAVAGVNIRAAVADFFAAALNEKVPNPAIDFGYRLLGSNGEPDYMIGWGAVFNAIQDATGVRLISDAIDGLLLNGIRGSVVLQPHEWPVPGTITIYDMDASGAEI